MHNVFPFIKWLLTKMFGWIINLHKKYKKFCSGYTGAGFMLVLFAYIITLGIVATGHVITNTTRYAGISAIVIAVLIFGYFFWLLFDNLYEQFKEEQLELFETLKK